MERAFLTALLGEDGPIEEILQEHGRIVNALEFQHSLQQAVSAAGGRNLKAIRALLDEEVLLGSENREQAMEQALRQLKKENPYLFEGGITQPYAAGAAARMGQGASMEDMGAMSMAEYKRFRRGY